MSETYTRRRSQVLAGMNPGELLLLYSGEAVPCSMDESYPFEANHHFYYLTGLRRENMALVLVKTESEEKEALFIEQPLPKLERWTGKRVTLEEARERSGIREVAFIGALQAYVERQLVRGGVTGLVMDCHKEALRAPDSYNLARAREWTGAFPALALRDAHPMISSLRMIKDEEEVALFRRAVDITDKGLRRILSTLAPGQMEYMPQAEFECEIRKQGAEGVSFATIAGSGKNGCMMHYGTNDARIQDGDLVLFDLGARYQGYCADITRTYPANGRYTERQRELYDLVLEANRQVAAYAAPGRTLKELNDLCKEVLGDGLVRLGLIEKKEDVGRYYMHGVSHLIGLDTHDCYDSASRPLEPGMIISDEPGVYVDEEGIGIRIEDDLLITENGCEVLSEAIPREAGEIEALMGARP